MKRILSEHKIGLIKVLLSSLLIIEAIVLSCFDLSLMSVVCYVFAYGIISYRIIFNSLRELFKEMKVGEELLMTVVSLGAMIIGELFEGTIVLVLYTVGEIFGSIASSSSRRTVEALAGIRPDMARLCTGDIVSVGKVEIGEIIEVYPGERIPLDGDVIEGTGYVDTSVMTGESVGVEVRVGSEVLAGYLNGESVLKIKVKRTADRSAAQRIIDLSQSAFEKKTKSERFISVFAKIYTPIVIVLSIALALVPPFFDNYDFTSWIYRALSMLAVACPCAVVIAVPLSYYCGVAHCARNGILVKSSSTLDSLCAVKAIAFDKTGTLTKSELHVTKIEPIAGIDKTELLRYVCIAEMKSSHPIALAVIKEAAKLNISPEEGENYHESIGFGVECDTEYGHIKAGNKEFVIAPEGTRANILVSINDRFIGTVSLGDEVKANSKIAFEQLTELGVKNKVILSGDKTSKVKAISRTLLADNAYAELTPEGKLETIEKLIEQTDGKVAYCGDGINDTPSIARADVGIAMGALGSDSAVETSDVVIMDDDVSKVAKAIKIAKRTRGMATAIVAVSLTVKLAVLALSALGIVPMIGAVVADVGVLIWAVACALFAGR